MLRELSEKIGIAFEEVPPLELGGEAVSSSRVRSALLAGDVANAKELLGTKAAEFPVLRRYLDNWTGFITM